ncbi:MAG: CotH kinase family protein [bacterium]|jgi:spore coat protein CotH/regulation of enolase protein 1 (concanavalin A-like superfamily)
MKYDRILFCIAIYMINCVLSAWTEPLRINEILTATTLEDEAGVSLEWIEIYNPGPDSIDLSQYSITDDPDEKQKWLLPPVTLPPDSYFLVMATGYDVIDADEYHANFQLDKEGEFIGIFSVDSSPVDTINYPPQAVDVSYGRSLDDPEHWVYFHETTPRAPNSREHFLGFTRPVSVSPAGGVYSEPVNVSVLSLEEGVTLRYTLDGSLPTASSAEYQSPLRISDDTVLRVRAFRPDYEPGRTVTHTYLFDEPTPLPILALSTNPSHLWDRRTGIYANATAHGIAWERPVATEMFDDTGKRWFQVDAGIRIHGGASRERSDKKSFRLYYRSAIGPSRLEFPVIPSTSVSSFDRLILRAGYNDSWVHWDAEQRRLAVYISDELGRRLHEDMGYVVSHGTFVNLYINGEYFGIYNLVERIDEEFLRSYYDYDEWDILTSDELKEGDYLAWNQLQNFVNRNDLSVQRNFDRLTEMIDLDQITAYYILNIYVQNHDWPHHNWYAARERSPQGKWKLFVWDIEDSFSSGASRGEYNLNTFERARQVDFLGTLFRRMLSNSQYQQYFIQRMEHYFETTLKKEHLLMRLDELADQVRDAMPMEAQRWNRNMNLDIWEAALDNARRFIDLREDVVRNHVYRGLRIPTPTPTVLPGQPTPTPPAGTPTPTPPVNGTPTPTPTPIQPGEGIGIFTDHRDIGNVQAPGDAEYIAAEELYIVTASGIDIWGTADEFHFLHRQVQGDFSLEATMTGENLGTSDWVKVLLMARESLHPSSSHYAIRIQESTNQASSQWRISTGSNADSTPGNMRINGNRHRNRFRLTRQGDMFSTWYLDAFTDDWVELDRQQIPMPEVIHVGLAVTSHDDGNYAKGYFSEVRLTGGQVAVQSWHLY